MKKNITLACALLLHISASFAAEVDVINESCQDAVQIVSMYPTISTFTGLKAQTDDWAKWTYADVAALPAGLAIDATNTSFNNGVLIVAFSLNGKTGTAVAWARNFGKTADGPTYLNQFGTNGKAVFIIPGSGTNESVQMMAGTGYEAILYSVGTAVGDAFIYSYPGQDLQGLICQNGNKYLPAAIDNYMQLSGTSTSHLILIQTAAIMKFLNTAHGLNASWPAYTQTAVLGLSKGAWNAMMTALITPPTAAVIASGVSVKEYRSIGFGAMGGNISQGLATAWPQAALTAAIKAAPTKWLFTMSNCCGEIAMMAFEAADGETGAAFANPNVTTLVHVQGHVYPAPVLNFLQTNLP